MRANIGWVVLAVAAFPPLARGATATEAPPLIVAAIEVEPSAPSSGTLCKLRVKISNTAEQDASNLVFAVKIGGSEMTVYHNHAWMTRVAAGTTATVDLHNFWVPDAGRRIVEVTLSEARWMKHTTEGETSVTTILGPVEGLPSTLTLDLK